MNSLSVVEFASDLSCTTCISAGFVYYYGTQARSDITDADGVDGYCCREMTDGTLFCGDEMDKIFEIYMENTSNAVTEARVEKVRESYLDLVMRLLDQDAKTKAQELYLDLYTAAQTFKSDSDEANLEAAFDLAEHDMLVYYNSPTSAEALQFIGWYDKLETDFPSNGGDVSEAGDGIQLVDAHFAQDFADQSQDDFTAIRGTVMLQALVGKTLEVKFSGAYEVVANDAAKSDIVNDSITGVDTTITLYLSSLHNIQSGTYDNDDAMIQQIFRTYFGSDDGYSTNTAFDLEFARVVSLALRAESLQIYNDEMMTRFVEGEDVVTGSYIENVTNLIPYLATDDGTADTKAYMHYRSLDTSKSDDATIAIQEAFEEFYAEGNVSLRFDGLLMFSLINQETLDSDQTTALAAVVNSYMEVIKNFDSSDALTLSGCNQTNRFVLEMVGTDDMSTLDSLTDKLQMMDKILKLTIELYDPSSLVYPLLGGTSCPNPLGCAATIAGLTKLTFTSDPQLITDAKTILDDPSTLLTTTGQSSMIDAYLEFFPVVFTGTETQKVFTQAQVDAIDQTNYQTTGVNSQYEELLDFLIDIPNGTNDNFGKEQEDVETAYNVFPFIKLVQMVAIRTFNQTIFSAMAMYTGDSRYNTEFTTENLNELFGVTSTTNQPLTTTEFNALDLTGTHDNAVQDFIDMMVELGLATAPTRSDYAEVFTPTAAVVVGKMEETPDEAEVGTITLSNQFATMEHALFSCPNHVDHCGDMMHDATDSDVTLSPQLYKGEQSCNYIVKVDGCGYPSVEMTAQTSDFLPAWYALYFEYSDSHVDSIDDDFVDASTVMRYVNLMSYEAMPNTLGLIQVTTDSGMKVMQAEHHVKNIALRKAMYAEYMAGIEGYEADVKAYNDAVKKVNGELPGWKDGSLEIGEERGPRGQRESALSKLPYKPTPYPSMPAFEGYAEEDIDVVTGFGVPTIGMFFAPNLYGQYKNFGMIGQDYYQDMFASATPDTEDTCGVKYVAINVAPYSLYSIEPANAALDAGLDGSDRQQYHEQWEFTVTNIDSEEIIMPYLTLTADEMDSATPTALSASPFLLTEGGVKLAASATLAAAVAFSLY